MTPRHLPLPALRSSFDAFQPHARPTRRVDTEPLSHSLSAASAVAPGATSRSEPAKPPAAHAPAHYGYYCNGYYYPYPASPQEYYLACERRTERGPGGLLTPAPSASPGAKIGR